MGSGVLYISYDGMLEPLGQSQVLAYLRHLAVGRSVHLISYEKPEDWARVTNRERIATDIASAGIAWHPLRYHKRPSAVATAWDILVGIAVGLWVSRVHRLSIVHARSYVPAVLALVLKKFRGMKFVFDMRGFWADERVDGNLWPRDGRMYRIAKWFERHFLLNADHVVSLTHAAVREMEVFPYLRDRMPPVTVISTCADLTRFVPAKSLPNGFVLGYVGSVGTWYLFDVVVACFVRLRKLRPNARLLIINRNEHSYIRQCLVAGGVPEDAVDLRSADHSVMPAQMSQMHAAVFFIKQAFSKQATAPTKLGEFLGCGIPCLSNTRVGDMADILQSENVGIAIDGFEEDALDEGLKALIALVGAPDIRARCVAVAQRHFSLSEGVARYQEIYEKLTDKT